jgi:endogenous inhibitor of DNA gyrase (YacG/DUF329 family)
MQNIIKCKHCGKDVIKDHSRRAYCNEVCYEEYYKKKKTIIFYSDKYCFTCGKKIGYNVKGNHCRKCYHEKRRQDTYNMLLSVLKDKECPECGKDLTSLAERYKKGEVNIVTAQRQIFCDWECQENYYEKKRGIK